MRRIAKALATLLSTTGRRLKSMGLGRLKNLQPRNLFAVTSGLSQAT